jgi:predicted HAD superfamily Cof-like phosphohydrolase
MTSNFQKVQLFNRAFDMVPKEPAVYPNAKCNDWNIDEITPFICFRPQLFTEQPKTIRLRLDLIKEEIGELNEAISQNDFIETRDALADILYVVYGMGDVLGINLDFWNWQELSPVPVKTVGYEICNRISDALSKYLADGKPNGLSNFDNVRIYIDVCIPLDTDIVERNGEYIITQINKTYTALEIICLRPPMCDDEYEEVYSLLRDLLKYVYIYCHLKGIDADADFAIVHNSNMSKLCDTEADAQATVDDYESKFKAGKSPYDSPYYYALPELGKWIIKNKSTGKALKNIKYCKVAF